MFAFYKTNQSSLMSPKKDETGHWFHVRMTIKLKECFHFTFYCIWLLFN